MPAHVVFLDTKGPIERAKQGREKGETKDKRVDLVLRELGRYVIRIAALQETKWFGMLSIMWGGV